MPVRSILRKVTAMFKKNPNAVLKNVKGVIHVGANSGQEAKLYGRYELPVVWIEPNPDVYEILKSNLKDFPKQIAIKALVTDLENVEYPFHLANNNGESSSILDFNLHKEIWPEVKYETTINLRSITLPTMLRNNHIDHKNYDMLVMDTQGSELLVLKGGTPILQSFNYIKAEVPDFESYKGCCQLGDLQSFLNQHGFREYSRHQFAKRRGGGSYYDIIYKKK